MYVYNEDIKEIYTQREYMMYQISIFKIRRQLLNVSYTQYENTEYIQLYDRQQQYGQWMYGTAVFGPKSK